MRNKQVAYIPFMDEEVEVNEENEKYIVPNSVIDEGFSEASYQPIDRVLNDLLKDEFKVLESKTDKEKKENALLKLNDILKTWMNKVNENFENIQELKNHSARLLCFGSYKLGVSTPKGDIDAIVLCPSYVDREKHFFGMLYSLFEEYSKYNENIKDLTSVNYVHSITPLIKMIFYDVQVDLLFAKMDNVA